MGMEGQDYTSLPPPTAPVQPQMGYVLQTNDEEHPAEDAPMLVQTTTTFRETETSEAGPPVATKWHSDLFSCGDGLGNCLFAYLCTPCAIADARNSFDQSNYFLNCCCLGAPLLTNIVREGYNIEGGCCTDVMLGTFCGPCTVIRAQQEVKARGPVTRPERVERPWSTSLVGCDECLVSTCLPSCALACARTDYDRSNFCFNLLCVPPAITRNIIREGYGIEGTWVGDICYMMWLPWCSIAQMRREVKATGPQSRAPRTSTVVTSTTTSTVTQNTML